jgi:hypothetical protein
MKTSIATVCLSGGLRETLKAITGPAQGERRRDLARLLNLYR